MIITEIVSAAPEAPTAVYGAPIHFGYAPSVGHVGLPELSTVQCEFLGA